MASQEITNPLSFQYRPDIDGLRALAVLPVLLYHAQLGCSGGFVGVDIFFVISGYVISSLILKEVAAGTFSMIHFWERRIRRIMPALSLVVVAVLAAGWQFYLPEDFQFLAKSVMSQALMAANFFFWKERNEYFDHDNDTHPLLHTWSLAVEEQFYLIFPLLLLVLFRSKAKSWRHWICGIAAGSFVLSVAGIYAFSYQRATFYLLPTRAWELLIGALLAMYHGRFSVGKLVSESSGFLGLALIGWAILEFDHATRFPGLAALLPCLGAALVLASSEAGPSIVGRLLSFKPLVFIGLVSYPLYLWHWPLLAFTRYLTDHELSAATRVELLLASLALAVLSWKFVETPFRQRRWLGERRQIFKFAGVVTGTLLTCALVVGLFQGFPSRYSDKALAFASSRDHHAFREGSSIEKTLAGQFTELGFAESHRPISLLVWGDSHAMAVAPALDQLCREHSERGVMVAFHGTPPVLNYISRRGFGVSDVAPKIAERVTAFISEHHVKNVLVTAKWNHYPASDEFKKDLILTIRAIIAAGSHVYVLKDVPEPGFDVPRFAAMTAMRGGDLEALGVTQDKHRQTARELEPTFEQLTQMGATVLDPADFFINSRGIYGVVKNDHALYFDSDHLTPDGAALLIPLFKPLFEAR